MTNAPLTRPIRTRPLTPGLLRSAFRQLPEETRANKFRFYSYCYFSVLEFFLGTDWLEKYILPESAKRNSFLFPDLKVEGRNVVWFNDLLQLADLLFNLQNVPGFDAAIEPMMGGDIESAMSVLYAGKLLKQAGRVFQFIEPMGVQGHDYDIALTYTPDQFAFLEVKCKARTTVRSYNSTKNALNRAMGQLPPDQPGIIFTQLPEAWIDREGDDWRVTGDVFKAAEDFLRNTSRVVMLVFYSVFITPGREFTLVDQGFAELPNPGSKFAGRDWIVFEPIMDGQVLGRWDHIDKYAEEALVGA